MVYCCAVNLLLVKVAVYKTGNLLFRLQPTSPCRDILDPATNKLILCLHRFVGLLLLCRNKPYLEYQIGNKICSLNGW